MVGVHTVDVVVLPELQRESRAPKHSENATRFRKRMMCWPPGIGRVEKQGQV